MTRCLPPAGRCGWTHHRLRTQIPKTDEIAMSLSAEGVVGMALAAALLFYVIRR